MAKAYRCDICSILYKADNSKTTNLIQISENQKFNCIIDIIITDKNSELTIDVCYDCMQCMIATHFNKIKKHSNC